MSFVNVELLGAHLGANFIGAFDHENEDVLKDNLIPTTDAMITRATGKQPPAEPDVTDVEIIQYAVWIIHYLMIEPQGVTDEKDIKHRRENFDLALKLLENCKGGTVDGSYEAPTARYAKTFAAGDRP